MNARAHTLVLDIGKSNAKLVLFNAQGEVVMRDVHHNAPIQADGYTALGIPAIEDWLTRTIPKLPQRAHIEHIGITTHGAAFCALSESGLAFPALDYEWDGYGTWRERYAALVDPFEVTGTPLLPQGLNAGLQLYWLQQTQPEEWARVQRWVPYPQYWAWWLTGQAVSEATSLGCHTHLWQPRHQIYAPWALKQGLVQRFAPLRPAHDVIGLVQPMRASALGLSAHCQVHVGLHDSNACLARHLHASPRATVVSTGTWTVAMTAGVDGAKIALDPAHDELLNQSIDGREYAHLCHGSDPSWATVLDLREVLDAGWSVSPQNMSQPGAVHGRVAELHLGVHSWGNQPEMVPANWRPALAAWYGACMTAHMLNRLWGPQLADTFSADLREQPVILEGPMADNSAFIAALSALLSPRPLLRCIDEVEGTARGAWLTTRWHQPSARAQYVPIDLPAPADVDRCRRAWTKWLNRHLSPV